MITSRKQNVFGSSHVTDSCVFRTTRLNDPLTRIRLKRCFTFTLPESGRSSSVTRHCCQYTNTRSGPSTVRGATDFCSATGGGGPHTLFCCRHTTRLNDAVKLGGLRNIFTRRPRPVCTCNCRPSRRLCGFCSGLQRRLGTGPGTHFPGLVGRRPLPTRPRRNFSTRRPSHHPRLWPWSSQGARRREDCAVHGALTVLTTVLLTVSLFDTLVKLNNITNTTSKTKGISDSISITFVTTGILFFLDLTNNIVTVY